MVIQFYKFKSNTPRSYTSLEILQITSFMCRWYPDPQVSQIIISTVI